MRRYSTILIDPPWQVKAGRPFSGEYSKTCAKQDWNFSTNNAQDLKYDSLSIAQIAQLPIENISYPDAHLYVWTINKYLPVTFDLIKQWGFQYSTTLVWAKNAMGGGLGGAYRITTEFLIFAKKGHLSAKEMHIGTWFNVKRDYDERGKPQHSRKPEFFAQLIEKISPGPYLEMFARRERKGWDVFGNQVSNSIKL